MRTLTLVIELDYDNEMMHGDDEEGIAWFRDEVLGKELILHSNEIGDEVGKVRLVRFVP